MSGETDSKGRPIDQQCRYCGKLFTAKALRKHVDQCPGPDGVRVCDLSGAARARRIRVVVDGVKKKKKRKSVFTVSGGAYGLGKSRKHWQAILASIASRSWMNVSVHGTESAAR
ncbi:C2HC-type zinc finger protein [Pseudomonas aeruginosa]